MSTQFEYVQSYPAMVDAFLASHPEDKAVEMAVGGAYGHIGVLEHALLREYGLEDGARVVDVGCGAGRLSTQLARYKRLAYTGLDVVPALLDYARRKTNRPDFRFEAVPGNTVPVPDCSTDFTTFFSVFTHLLHEESFVYLEHAHRILAPGGVCIFSFLEFGVEGHWTVFGGNCDWVRKRSYLGHINVFMHPADLRMWAERLGFRVLAIRAGDAETIVVSEEIATETTPAGRYALGQSICVLDKPA